MFPLTFEHVRISHSKPYCFNGFYADSTLGSLVKHISTLVQYNKNHKKSSQHETLKEENTQRPTQKFLVRGLNLKKSIKQIQKLKIGIVAKRKLKIIVRAQNHVAKLKDI